MAFTSLKNNLQRNKALKLLAFIVTATTQAIPPATVPAGFAYIPEKDADTLAKSEPTFFSIDKTTKDPNGNVKVVALQPAVDAQVAIASAAPAGGAAANAAPAAKPVFSIRKGVTLPPTNRGINKTDIYPFDIMEVDDSFVVESTEQRPNPAKSLASTCSSATKRYKGQTPERKFVVRPIKAGVNGETVNGASVWRTQ